MGQQDDSSFCGKCGTKLEAGNAFCSACGAPAPELPQQPKTSKKVLDFFVAYVPGFRTLKVWKMIVACLYYLFTIMLFIANFWVGLWLLSIPFAGFNIVRLFISIAKGKTPQVISLIASVVIFIASFVIIGVTSADSEASLESLKAELAMTHSARTATPTPTATASPTPAQSVYQEGMYKVGQDLAAGTYYVIADHGAGYYAVTIDSSGEPDAIIAKGDVATFSFITAKDGEYLEVKDASFQLSSQVPAIQPVDGKYGTGMYRIGIDLEAGEYQLIPDGGDKCYVAVLSNAAGVLSSIVSEDNFSAMKYIEVKAGQYLELKGCHIAAK